MATTPIDLSQTSSVTQERTADAPSQQSPQQNQEQSQLTEDLKKALMSIPEKYCREWMISRRQVVQQAMKKLEFYKGNQLYLAFNPYSDSFISSLDVLSATAQGQGKEGQGADFDKNVTNIYQTFCRTYISILSGGQTPKTRHLPQNAEKEADVTTAKAASTLDEHIERKNKLNQLIKKALLYMWIGPGYWRYSRYIIDGDRAGVHKEPVMALVPQPISEDRYICSQCGTETPESQLSQLAGLRCPNCTAPLGGNDFHPGETLPLPTQVGEQDVPNGMTKQTMYNILYVETAPNADDINATPILRLAEEMDIAYLRKAYPDCWNQLKKGTGGSGGGVEGEVERLARQRIYSATAGRINNLSSADMPTLYRTWITPEAFYKVDNKDQADKLAALYPKGCKLVTAGENFLEAVEEKLSDHWTQCFTQEGFGVMAPGAGDSAVDIQERLNEVMSIVQEHMETVASFTLLCNEEIISSKALNGKRIRSNTITGVKLKPQGPSSQLEHAFFQPKPTLDPEIYTYADKLIFLAQMLTGILPQTWGGAQAELGDTFGAQKQALNTAMGKMKLDWEQLREECAAAAQISVRIEADAMKELNQDMIEAVLGESKEAVNKYVRLSDLQGEFVSYPEADQGFPMSYAEMRDVLMRLAEFASKNPDLFGPLLAQPANQKLFSIYCLPPGTVLPGDAERSTTLRTIDDLLKEPYIPAIHGPEPIIDDPDAIIETAKQWCQENKDIKMSNPQGWQNILAYLGAVAGLKNQQMMEAAAQQALLQPPKPADKGAPTA